MTVRKNRFVEYAFGESNNIITRLLTDQILDEKLPFSSDPFH